MSEDEPQKSTEKSTKPLEAFGQLMHKYEECVSERTKNKSMLLDNNFF